MSNWPGTTFRWKLLVKTREDRKRMMASRVETIGQIQSDLSKQESSTSDWRLYPILLGKQFRVHCLLILTTVSFCVGADSQSVSLPLYHSFHRFSNNHTACKQTLLDSATIAGNRDRLRIALWPVVIFRSHVLSLSFSCKIKKSGLI